MAIIAVPAFVTIFVLRNLSAPLPLGGDGLSHS
jgi:hypothetical protein